MNIESVGENEVFENESERILISESVDVDVVEIRIENKNYDGFNYELHNVTELISYLNENNFTLVKI